MSKSEQFELIVSQLDDENKAILNDYLDSLIDRLQTPEPASGCPKGAD